MHDAVYVFRQLPRLVAYHVGAAARMSPDPSPYTFWRGMILSPRNDTEADRRYVEGILFALAQVAEAPDCADITPRQVAELEELHDRGTAEFGG